MAKKIENTERYTKFLIDNILYPTERSYWAWSDYLSYSRVTDFPDRVSEFDLADKEVYVRCGNQTRDEGEYFGIVNDLYFYAKQNKNGNHYDILVCEKIDNGEIFIFSMHISPYEQGNRYNHQPERVRKLLLNKQEIRKMSDKIKKEGYTIGPLELFLSHGFAKIEIGLAKGKKLYDKREAIAKKTMDRDIARHLKG